MKLFTRPKRFSEAIALVTNLNCLLGLRAFEYPRGYPRPILSLIYVLFICGIYSYNSIRLERKYNQNVTLMKMEHLLYEVFMYITLMSMILKMLLGWWHTKKFKVCHKKIFKIDETLQQLGLSTNYDRIYFVTVGIITVWITSSFILSVIAISYVKIRTDMFTAICIILIYLYSINVHAITVFEFYIFVKCLQIKFKLVNQLLCEKLTNLSTEERLGIFDLKDYAKIINIEQRKHIFSKNIKFQLRRRMQSQTNVSVSEERQNPIISQIETEFLPSQFKKQLQNKLRNQSQRRSSIMAKYQERKHLLQIIKQIHLELCKISKMVCTILGIQIAWTIGEIIIILTGSLYYFYMQFIIQHHNIFLEQTIWIFLMCFLSILTAVLMSRNCKNTADEANKTIEIIHAIYGCDADTDMQEEIQQFSIQILQSPVIFFVFGLTLDNRILSSVCIKLYLKEREKNVVIVILKQDNKISIIKTELERILKTVSTYIVIMIQMSYALESNNAV